MKEEARFEKTAFLVKDDSIPDYNGEFMRWLRSEGFRCGVQKNDWGCSWIFVSITNKMFAFGMPGIKIIQPVGDHAITAAEFKMIYEIFKKYEGLDPLVFQSAEEPQKEG